MFSDDPLLTLLVTFAIVSMLLGFVGTWHLMQALPHVRPGVARAAAATAVKRPFLRAPLNTLFLEAGMHHATRGLLWSRAQYALMAVSLLMVLAVITR